MVPAAVVPQGTGVWPLPSSAAESTVTGQSGGSRARRRRDSAAAASASEDESSRLLSASSGANDLTDTEDRQFKIGKSRDGNGDSKAEAEASSSISKMLVDQNAEPSEAHKQDYIHVRARRGQATDSHSLAERARREKISDRMKILQDLVPGCNKVIGKASVLDEIINYIQALQCQVEFLSRKLEAVNSQMDSGVEAFPPKNFGSQTYEATSSMDFNSQAMQEYGQASLTEGLHMQVGGAFERVT